MTAQWEDECISLSVLSMARAMIGQWEKECISLPVLSVAQVMITHAVGERMYFTACPLHGPGHDLRDL